MHKIMFICHGNICRSTMAQSYFIHILKQNNLENKFIVDSSATSFEEIGQPPHRGTKMILKSNNIKLVNHKAKRITKIEADEFDYLICMDNNNISNLKRIIDKSNYHKISRLLEFANEKRDISDPWYTGNFDQTFNDVKKGCDALLKLFI